MATSGQFGSPPPLEVNSGNVSENYKRWKREMEVYLAASDTSAKDERYCNYFELCRPSSVRRVMITSRGKVMMINKSQIKYWKP